MLGQLNVLLVGLVIVIVHIEEDKVKLGVANHCWFELVGLLVEPVND